MSTPTTPASKRENQETQILFQEHIVKLVQEDDDGPSLLAARGSVSTAASSNNANHTNSGVKLRSETHISRTEATGGSTRLHRSHSGRHFQRQHRNNSNNSHNNNNSSSTSSPVRSPTAATFRARENSKEAHGETLRELPTTAMLKKTLTGEEDEEEGQGGGVGNSGNNNNSATNFKFKEKETHLIAKEIATKGVAAFNKNRSANGSYGVSYNNNHKEKQELANTRKHQKELKEFEKILKKVENDAKIMKKKYLQKQQLHSVAFASNTNSSSTQANHHHNDSDSDDNNNKLRNFYANNNSNDPSDDDDDLNYGYDDENGDGGSGNNNNALFFTSNNNNANAKFGNMSKHGELALEEEYYYQNNNNSHTNSNAASLSKKNRNTNAATIYKNDNSKNMQEIQQQTALEWSKIRYILTHNHNTSNTTNDNNNNKAAFNRDTIRKRIYEYIDASEKNLRNHKIKRKQKILKDTFRIDLNYEQSNATAANDDRIIRDSGSDTEENRAEESFSLGSHPLPSFHTAENKNPDRTSALNEDRGRDGYGSVSEASSVGHNLVVLETTREFNSSAGGEGSYSGPALDFTEDDEVLMLDFNFDLQDAADGEHFDVSSAPHAHGKEMDTTSVKQSQQEDKAVILQSSDLILSKLLLIANGRPLLDPINISTNSTKSQTTKTITGNKDTGRRRRSLSSDDIYNLNEQKPTNAIPTAPEFNDLDNTEEGNRQITQNEFVPGQHASDVGADNTTQKAPGTIGGLGKQSTARRPQPQSLAKVDASRQMKVKVEPLRVAPGVGDKAMALVRQTAYENEKNELLSQNIKAKEFKKTVNILNELKPHRRELLEKTLPNGKLSSNTTASTTVGSNPFEWEKKYPVRSRTCPNAPAATTGVAITTGKGNRQNRVNKDEKKNTDIQVYANAEVLIHQRQKEVFEELQKIDWMKKLTAKLKYLDLLALLSREFFRESDMTASDPNSGANANGATQALNALSTSIEECREVILSTYGSISDGAANAAQMHFSEEQSLIDIQKEKFGRIIETNFESDLLVNYQVQHVLLRLSFLFRLTRSAYRIFISEMYEKHHQYYDYEGVFREVDKTVKGKEISNDVTVRITLHAVRRLPSFLPDAETAEGLRSSGGSGAGGNMTSNNNAGGEYYIVLKAERQVIQSAVVSGEGGGARVAVVGAGAPNIGASTAANHNSGGSGLTKNVSFYGQTFTLHLYDSNSIIFFHLYKKVGALATASASLASGERDGNNNNIKIAEGGFHVQCNTKNKTQLWLPLKGRNCHKTELKLTVEVI